MPSVKGKDKAQLEGRGSLEITYLIKSWFLNLCKGLMKSIVKRQMIQLRKDKRFEQPFPKDVEELRTSERSKPTT